MIFVNIRTEVISCLAMWSLSSFGYDLSLAAVVVCHAVQ